MSTHHLREGETLIQERGLTILLNAQGVPRSITRRNAEGKLRTELLPDDLLPVPTRDLEGVAFALGRTVES